MVATLFSNKDKITFLVLELLKRLRRFFLLSLFQKQLKLHECIVIKINLKLF